MTDAPYLALVIAHFRRPRNARPVPGATHAHEGTNPLCGDRLRMEVRIEEGRLADLGFQASACAIATASASLLTERLRGATRAELDALTDDDVVEALGAGFPPPRRGCATLSLRVLRQALGA